MIDSCRTFHENTEECIFLSSIYQHFSKMGHILGHKANLNKFKKTESTFCVLPDHKWIKLDINNRKLEEIPKIRA